MSIPICYIIECLVQVWTYQFDTQSAQLNIYIYLSYAGPLNSLELHSKNVLPTRILLCLVVEPALNNHEHVVYTDTWIENKIWTLKSHHKLASPSFCTIDVEHGSLRWPEWSLIRIHFFFRLDHGTSQIWIPKLSRLVFVLQIQSIFNS